MSITTPTITATRLLSPPILQQLYNSGSSFNNLALQVAVTGSTFTTTGLVCQAYSSANTFTAYVWLASGSATTLGNSGSVYWIDWSPDGVRWNGTGSGALTVSYTGSIAALNQWVPIQFTGSAPYWHFILKNCTGSAISGSVIIWGR